MVFFLCVHCFSPPECCCNSVVARVGSERSTRLCRGRCGGREDGMAEVDPTTVTTHVRAYWAKKKKVLDEIVLKDTLGAPAADPCV